MQGWYVGQGSPTGIINMFNAQVKLIDDKQARYKITTYTETLYEAEIYLTQALSMQLHSKAIVLEYEHDTIYTIYDYGEPVGTIEIFLGD